jgi:hypothetical protein
MTTIEYRHVRFVFGWMGVFSKKVFHERLMFVLQEQGNDGWELKGIMYELGLHAHLIFARTVRGDSTGIKETRLQELVER